MLLDFGPLCTPLLVKDQYISGFFLLKASLRSQMNIGGSNDDVDGEKEMGMNYFVSFFQELDF